MSDQIGVNISGLIFFRKKEESWLNAIKQYTHRPVMLASLLVILIVPIGSLEARVEGFRAYPKSQ